MLGLHAVAGLQVHVVDDHVRMGDAPLVVLVVDDRHLVIREVRTDPCLGKPPKGREVDAVLRVGRDDEVLEGARLESSPL